MYTSDLIDCYTSPGVKLKVLIKIKELQEFTENVEKPLVNDKNLSCL